MHFQDADWHEFTRGPGVGEERCSAGEDVCFTCSHQQCCEPDRAPPSSQVKGGGAVESAAVDLGVSLKESTLLHTCVPNFSALHSL